MNKTNRHACPERAGSPFVNFDLQLIIYPQFFFPSPFFYPSTSSLEIIQGCRHTAVFTRLFN
jgi:hypothetical protein